LSVPTPPTLWTRILRTTLPHLDRDDVVRELEVLYRVRCERYGERAARRWYRSEVLSFVKTIGINRHRRPTVTPSNLGRQWLMADVWRDVRHAGRSLRQSPGFSAVTLLTFTLGVGANTLIFSVVDHVAFRALPYPDPDRLVSVWPGNGVLLGELDAMQRNSRTLSPIAGYYVPEGFNLEVGDETRRINGSMVSVELFPLLGVTPLLGRTFARDESGSGAGPVAMLAQDFWREQFGSDPNVVGRSIIVDGISRTVVGVLPAGFRFPSPPQDLIIPIVMDRSNAGLFWGWGGHKVIARLQPGATLELAQEELFRLSLQTRLTNPIWTPSEDFRANSTVVPMRDAMIGDIQSTLWLLLGAVGLVLLVACANVANLLLARGLSRGRDIALRCALGATRWRLIRAHLVDSLLIAGLGCGVALAAAYAAMDAVVAFVPAEIPRADEIRLDGRIVAASVFFSLAAGVLAGVLPALRGSRVDPGLVLREVGRGMGGSAQRRRRLSAVIVVAQVALAVVLVTGAGLFIRSLGALAGVDTGFAPERVTTARLTLAGDAFDNAVERYHFFESILERTAALPGVRSATLASRVPFTGSPGGIATFIDGVTQDPNDLPILHRVQVMPGYFATLGIPLLEGREIESSDGPDGRLVALVDRTAAEQFWPGESPVGRRIRYPWRGAPWLEVVGVVDAVADGDLAAARYPTFYVPFAQLTPGAATLAIRSDAGSTLQVAGAIREIVRDVDDRVPVSEITPLTDHIAGSMARTRWTATLLLLFAATTLSLGCVGVYGVVTYSVRARTQEIGVRMALGANRARIRRSVLKQGLALALTGTAVGLLLAVPAARILEGLLFGVSTLDPVTFATVPLLLIVAAIVAAYLPARRATDVHPLDALRAEP